MIEIRAGNCSSSEKLYITKERLLSCASFLCTHVLGNQAIFQLEVAMTGIPLLYFPVSVFNEANTRPQISCTVHMSNLDTYSRNIQLLRAHEYATAFV
jgi:hypothetical protein